MAQLLCWAEDFKEAYSALYWPPWRLWTCPDVTVRTSNNEYWSCKLYHCTVTLNHLVKLIITFLQQDHFQHTKNSRAINLQETCNHLVLFLRIIWGELASESILCLQENVHEPCKFLAYLSKAKVWIGATVHALFHWQCHTIPIRADALKTAIKFVDPSTQHATYLAGSGDVGKVIQSAHESLTLGKPFKLISCVYF